MGGIDERDFGPISVVLEGLLPTSTRAVVQRLT
jgi:hypothetical protein